MFACRVGWLIILSKTVASVWQIYLMVGPEFEQVRAFCGCVRSFTTDMGVKRLLAQVTDMLPDFYRLWLGVSLPRGAEQLLRLIPKALQIGGWRHLFDTLIQRGMVTLSFFPWWIDKCKAVVPFSAILRSLRNFVVVCVPKVQVA